MNIKIIISLILFVTTHHSFCMIVIKQDQKKYTAHIHAIQQKWQQNNQKEVDEYLKPFMYRSLLENSELFHKQDYLVKRGIIRQCKENHDTSPIITIIQLPKDMQISVISHFFTNRCRLAAEDFICKPFNLALKEYNDLPDNNLTLLSSRHKLEPSKIFRSSKELQRILTKIYTNDIITAAELHSLTQLPKDILQKILEQNPNITMLENESKLLVLLTAPYYAEQDKGSLFTFKLCSTIGTLIIDLSVVVDCYAFLNNTKNLIPAIIFLTLANPSIQFALHNFWNRHNLSNYYNTATTSTITKPLQSLL